MQLIEKERLKRNLSQRKLAILSGVSFRTIQLLEGGRHDPRLSTLQKLLVSLNLSRGSLERRIRHLFHEDPNSAANTSEHIFDTGEESWKIWLFNFVDAFRKVPRIRLVKTPPFEKCPERIRALLASTVETLCVEKGIPIPDWCESIPHLSQPWFVSGTEALKPMALVEGLVFFRKRNIFVLGNFLERQ